MLFVVNTSNLDEEDDESEDEDEDQDDGYQNLV